MSVTTTDPRLLTILTAVLTEFDKEDRIFSAFDVTKRIRTEVNKQGNPFYADHFQIRELVHEFYNSELPPFQNGSDYVREDYTDNRGVTFQVFRKIGSDINTYDEREIKVVEKFIPSKSLGPVHHGKFGNGTAFNPTAIKSPATYAPTVPAKVANVSTPAASLSTSIARVGSRGRLLIRRDDVAKIGLLPGDSAGVYEVIGKQQIVITHSGKLMSGITHSSITTALVDKYGEIRLGSWVITGRLAPNPGHAVVADTALRTLVIQ